MAYKYRLFQNNFLSFARRGGYRRQMDDYGGDGDDNMGVAFHAGIDLHWTRISTWFLFLCGSVHSDGSLLCQTNQLVFFFLNNFLGVRKNWTAILNEFRSSFQAVCWYMISSEAALL